jgi:hypothetical protein
MVGRTLLKLIAYYSKLKEAVSVELKRPWRESNPICYYVNLYGSHRIMFITKQTTLIYSDFKQVYYSLKLLPLHVGYMFRPVRKSSLGISVKKFVLMHVNTRIEIFCTDVHEDAKVTI